jgi:hypothetical protein
MLLNYAQAFTILAADLERIRAQVLIIANDCNTSVLNLASPKMRDVLEILSKLLATCQQMPQLDRMDGPIGRLLATIEAGTSPSAFNHHVDFMQLQLLDELERLRLYNVTETLAAIYDNPQPFGEDVFEAFPGAVLDSQNAGKCLALGQPTACMFHLMRVLEHGLTAYAEKLGIQYSPSWEACLNKLAKEFEVSWDKRSQKWKKETSFHKQVMGDLTAIKIAWRNPTIHIVNDYDESEALRAYSAVLGFMQHLATNKVKQKRRSNKLTA